MSDIERLRQLTENCRNEKNQHMIGNIEIIYHETWFPDMQKRAEKGFPFINIELFGYPSDMVARFLHTKGYTVDFDHSSNQVSW